MTTDVKPLAVSPTMAAKLLSVSKRHIYHLIEEGHIDHRWLGRRILIPTTEIDRILGRSDA